MYIYLCVPVFKNTLLSIETYILGSIGLQNNSLNHILHANTLEHNEDLDYEITTIKHSPYCGFQN